MSVNRQLCLKRNIQQGEPVSLDLFEVREAPLPEPAAGEFLVKTAALGFSPAQRAYLMGTASRFHAPVDLGEVMRGRGVGRVMASRHPDFREGDVVACSTGWQDYSIQSGDVSGMLVKTLQRVSDPQQPLHLHLGILGSSGFSAYFGFLDIGRPQAGDTVVVSAAAGGVGSIVCQIARLKGCRVVGIAGGAEKCAWLKQVVGVDEAIDYKADDLDQKFQEYCPSGIDVYFDNVGGDTLDAAMKNIALRGRAVICGMISTEYHEPPLPGPRYYYNLIYKRARMEGFFVWDYHEQFPAAEKELIDWYKAGDLKPTEVVYQGLLSAPDALQSLFSGADCGIRVVDC
ncbi:NADP-dependent oxidoreductase [Parahaliea maris]|uniref:NADP-dependent oxidoreductase n=1 Tax=Parahaliea maris TaxID=2716870 RepID=A0A5C8ZWY9_9GAMM|nr:NADP-dependent oxidoreductase [Parahaliea maris]TXS91997.1 NADP-dependent oxidoreductase [Parahaliea maris]